MLKKFNQLLPLLLLIFIDSFSYFVIIPILLEIYFNHPGSVLSPTTHQFTRNFLTGLTISLSTLASLLAAPLIGSASDTYGRKKTLLLCLIGTSIGFFIPIIGILKKSVALILLGRILGGIGSASQPIAQAAVADISKGKEKAFFLSLIALAMTIALILGPLVGGYLSDAHFVSWFNPTTPYLFSTLISIANFLLVLFFFHETAHYEKPTQILRLSEIKHSLFTSINTYHLGSLLGKSAISRLILVYSCV
jgi:MFS family permease